MTLHIKDHRDGFSSGRTEITRHDEAEDNTQISLDVLKLVGGHLPATAGAGQRQPVALGDQRPEPRRAFEAKEDFAGRYIVFRAGTYVGGIVGADRGEEGLELARQLSQVLK